MGSNRAIVVQSLWRRLQQSVHGYALLAPPQSQLLLLLPQSAARPQDAPSSHGSQPTSAGDDSELFSSPNARSGTSEVEKVARPTVRSCREGNFDRLPRVLLKKRRLLLNLDMKRS